MAIFLRIFSSALGYVYQKNLTDKGVHPLVITLLTYVLLSFVCIPLLINTSESHIDKTCWLYAVLMGACGAVGNSFFVKAVKDGELSILGPINSYKVIIGLILGIIFLHEIPDIIGILGIILICAGSFFLLETTDEKFTLKLLKNKSIQYRFISLLFCSIEAILIKKVIILSSEWEAYILWCFFGAIFTAIFCMIEKIDFLKESSKFKKKHTINIINTVVCVGIMQFSTNYIFAKMNVAYALSLFQLSSIICILLGYKFFQERHILKRLAGSTIMIAGAVMIILFN